jgi:hypothetical protein
VPQAHRFALRRSLGAWLVRASVVTAAFAATAFSCGDKQHARVAGEIAVRIVFDTKDFPGKIAVHTLRDPTLRPWVTGNGKTLEELPAGPEIEGGVVDVRPGGIKRLVLVAHNATSKMLHFFAAPHAVEPTRASLGFEFRCLCLNHAYKIPAGAYWYRVIELKLDRAYKSDQEVVVKHALFAVDDKRAAQMQQPGATIEPPAAKH